MHKMAKDKRWIKPGYTTQMLADYEKQRRETIANNQSIMHSLGLHRASTSLSASNLSKKRKRVVNDGDNDYRPVEHNESLSSSNSDNGNAVSSNPRMEKVAHKGPTRRSYRLVATQEVEATIEEDPIPLLPPSSNSGLDNHPDTSSSQRRGRGSAKPWKGWGKGKKMLEWNSKCQPIGDDAPKLSSQLGYFARQGSLFPLTVTSWDKMDKHRIDTIWTNIKDNTNAPDGYKDLCIKKINFSWKRFKHDLKEKYYDKFETDEERIAVTPCQVDPDQWKSLVKFWGTEKSKKIASQNSQNRANLCCYPRTGKTSFAQVMEEMMGKGLLVDKLEVWRYTRKRNELYNDTDGSADKKEMIKRRLEELTKDQQKDVETRDKIFEEVIGSDGHGRCLCMGVDLRLAPKRSTTSSLSSQHYEEEIAQLRKEAEEREFRHHEELDSLRAETDKVRSETDDKINQTKEFFLNIFRQVGISLPNDIPGI